MAAVTADDETREEESSHVLQASTGSAAISLEGTLYCRKGRASGSYSSLRWKRRFVFLDLVDGGSITIYRDPPNSDPYTSGNKQTAPRTASRLESLVSQTKSIDDDSLSNIEMFIPAELSWVAKDVENNTSSFVVEIPTISDDVDFIVSDESMCSSMLADSPRDYDANEDGNAKSGNFALLADMSRSKAKGKPFRIYFRCSKGSTEKDLWLRVFSRLQRLSNESRKRKNLFVSLTTPIQIRPNGVRIRSRASVSFAREARQLELDENVDLSHAKNVDFVTRDNCIETTKNTSKSLRSKDKEFLVSPSYAYPHRWMTENEMNEEMLLPSERFHNLRIKNCQQKEIGSLRIEVLQCFGLPKLDRASKMNASVYIVCGSYAFSTDVITNFLNPMWLRKSRRACEIPLFEAYARLYVGVFDDEGQKGKDDFAGRVAIDLARLRPQSTYDVTLPLRLSSHVYSRRRRGAIRLRFTLMWTSERDALMSYIPTRIKIPLPQNSKPRYDVTVKCSDEKALRNIAITVHGAHLPGRFTFQKMRATIREINYTRKYIFTSIRVHIRETRYWQNPAMSAFVFFSWMHCVYANSFSLVPAYVVLYFLLHLMKNYAKYAIDGPAQQGFIPPCWEEMFMALICGSNPDYRPIEPLNLAPQPSLTTETTIDSSFDVRSRPPDSCHVSTHVPRGKVAFRLLGFLPKQNLEEMISSEDEHLEFPFSNAFSNGAKYPKFGVKECLVSHKGEEITESTGRNCTEGSMISQTTSNLDAGRNGLLPRFTLGDRDFSEIMRKDSSGLKDFDEEEENFAPSKAVIASGKKAASNVVASGKAVGSTLTRTATATATGLTYAANEFSEITGLNHVMSPIFSSITGGVNLMMAPIQSTGSTNAIRRSDTADNPEKEIPDINEKSISNSAPILEDSDDIFSDQTANTDNPSPVTHNNSSDKPWPEQNIDLQGPTTGKKLTDDLADIEYKVHDLTWHLFDDHTYVVKSPDALYFGQAKKSEKKRRKKDITRELDKLLRVGQYSHSNPFVARVGLYVEPITSSANSFLCLFRAGFNVMTWRDPMLTFWLSLFCGLLVVILFVFPWRIFLFFLSIFLVGPQNWMIRLLRERNYLPTPRNKHGKPEESRDEKDPEKKADGGNVDLSACQPVFSSHNNKFLSKGHQADPREIHEVVIPYSPLIHQRFYDWPPEAQYAHATPENGDARHKFTDPNNIVQRPRSASLDEKYALSGARYLDRESFHRRRASTLPTDLDLGLTPPSSPRKRNNSEIW